ncbi:MAG: iron-sulfur cluster repair di-iron protein [Sphingobacteriales bacterium]|nr:iron-sulfur cluster repair di-iron protein [Sphingobacteriales bacterium]MBI3717208.1 iron-sulfur cluster repair di-iron protein [Sphingobacteriales bacterium]RTL58945.1 MAG: iron-sulfur cluster repair di-iron protein [Sphingobacteriales bacterium]
MNNLANESLAKIVKSNFRTASVFEKYHLDFCCKGKRSLQQACDENHVSVNEVVSTLEEVIAGGNPIVDFDKYTVSALIDYIVNTHHAYVLNESPQLYTWLQKVAAKHGERHPEMLKVFSLFHEVKEELMHHMQKEELVLFPRIKELETLEKEGAHAIGRNHTYITAPVSMMEQEHEHAGELLEQIRILTSNYTPPADACTTYRLSFASLQAFEADLHQHVHLENNLLFSKAIALIEKLTQSSAN